MAALPAMLVVGAACGGSNNTAGKSTPSTGATRSAAVASVTSAAAAAGSALSEIATDNKYSATRFSAKAGQPVTLKLDNQGTAIHNWHVLDTKDTEGKDIKMDLLEAGKSATISFTISKPGTYNFHCDVHPDQMKGTITVA